MARIVGGAKVESGYYWNPRAWEVQVVGEGGGVLPGDAKASYVRVPFPLVLLVVPVAGLAFLVALPLIGFGLFAWAGLKRLSGGARQAASDLAGTVTPGWQPGEAHLTGKPSAGEPAPGAKDPELEALEKEIAVRREEK